MFPFKSFSLTARSAQTSICNSVCLTWVPPPRLELPQGGYRIPVVGYGGLRGGGVGGGVK